ncbi:MAG: DUF1015 family protein, partial [Clostridia bacterium]
MKTTKVPEILLPNSSVDMEKWAVVACDQFTSEPSYWEELKQSIGDCPSTLNVIFPEVYLNKDNEQIITNINKTMTQYLN